MHALQLKVKDKKIDPTYQKQAWFFFLIIIIIILKQPKEKIKKKRKFWDFSTFRPSGN